MTTASRVTAAALCLTAVLGVSSCSSADAPPEPTATTNSTQPEPAAPEPTEPATPEVVIPTEPGDLVPADQIDAAREAGVTVYVSPNGDGNGIVVDPDATLPEELIAEVETVEGMPQNATQHAEHLGLLGDVLDAHDDAGTQVIAIIGFAEVTGNSAEITGYVAVGSAATGKFTVRGAKGEVLAAAQAHAAANPGTTIVDLTD
ncbi:hypothetical protein [Pseudactinotalea terrae]|uniref:hypothetical protein n=1 Tax=Pseudactinotalea terrae TaxID=1743262 RepID=UPI0012E2B93B|nr:hypothetical protein [Pseudactinotalea terrae]